MIGLIALFPLLGFLVNGLWYAFGQAPAGCSKAKATVPGVVASLSIFASFVVSVILFTRISGMPEDYRVIEEVLFSWMRVGEFNINVGFRFDSLSALFSLVITGVGTLIHVYSMGYMSHDETPTKYFAYLNLFCFAMLVLVLGSSLPILFLGWEGVGLCSYLLIGYWYGDKEKASAGKKAFIVNRVGDFGFLLGMFLIFTTFGTLEYTALQEAVEQNTVAAIGLGTITTICLLLFLGCTGKSAQIPLYIWLPDAMAGPTPVSALIHAATMVTSGIYMVTRLNYLFVLSPTAMSVIAWVGALTALFAATIAIVQTDIKKVLAYSTVSQLGYMFLACGVGAFGAGVFHVITHAFFKALLFLGAGSVIFGMHHEQDILKMGGLKSKMPKTFLVFAAGWLAICGIPPFSGFFSKDEILWFAFSSPHGSKALWLVGAVTAVMTAFYMTRLFSLTFLGKPRFKEDGKHVPHESPNVMVVPLMVLAFLSVVGGFMGIPHMSWLHHWLAPILGPDLELLSPGYMEWVLMALSVCGAAFGIFMGLRLYSNLSVADGLKNKWKTYHSLLSNKWYVDEFFEAAIVKPIAALSQFTWKVIDVQFIDWIVVGFGRLSLWTGQTIRVIHTGSLQTYAIMLLMGLVIALGYLVYGLG